MLAVQDTQHIAEAWGRQLHQYQMLSPQGSVSTQTAGEFAASRIGALIVAFADQVQLLENMFFALNQGQMLFNGTTFPAIGAQLDGLGTLIGEPRNGLSDSEYAIFLMGRVAALFSDGTIAAIGNATALLFQAPSVVVTEIWPEEIGLEVPASSVPAQRILALITQLLVTVLDAEVSLGYIASNNPAAFRFGDTHNPAITSAGFGDATNNAVGGTMSTLIY